MSSILMFSLKNQFLSICMYLLFSISKSALLVIHLFFIYFILFFFKKKKFVGTSLAVQWLIKTLLPSAGGAGLIPGRGAKNPHAWRPKTKT